MRTSSKRCLFLHTLEESRSRNHALILIFQTCSRVVIYTHTAPSFHCFPSLICVFTEICKTRFRSSGQSFREDHQSPRNEINYSIATLFTRFQDFYPPTLSLHSIDIITLRLSTHSPFQKECAITVLNSIELLWLHVITYIHTCNIAQNWKSIVEEITRDRFTLPDLFHETRATYRKRVIKLYYVTHCITQSGTDYVIFRHDTRGEHCCSRFGGLDGPE